MLQTIQRVQMRASQMSEIQRFQEGRYRLKAEAEEERQRILKENSMKIQ